LLNPGYARYIQLSVDFATVNWQGDEGEWRERNTRIRNMSDGSTAKVTNIEEVRARARSILKLHRFYAFRNSIIPVTAHIGSIVTIFAAWFMRTGQFNFRVNEWLDWLVLVVSLFIAFSGIRLVYFSVTTPKTITVRRSELVDLIAALRLEADESIVNFAGDLSWLTEDFETSKAIRSESPSVKMEIYYDRSRTPSSLSQLLDEYRKIGIEVIPYPDGVDPQLRCMLIDRGNANSRRMYVYTRVAAKNLGQPRCEQLFTWQQIGPTDGMGIEAVIDLISALKARRKTPILVGISGANNVGKTSIVSKAKQLISQEYSVQVIDDEFRMMARGSTKDDAYSTLCSQLVRLQSLHGDVCIVDRTLVDNLCFLRLRDGKAEKSYSILAPRIAEIMRKFDLTFDVKRSKETFDVSTKFVSGPDRKQVREYLDDFFANFNIKTMQLTTDADKFDESVETAALAIAEAAKVALRLRRTA
jgi:hypothetical protein